VTKKRVSPVNHLSRQERKQRWADAEREGRQNGAIVITERAQNAKYLWQQFIADSALCATIKHVALTLSLYGSANGSNIFPGVRELEKRTSLSGRSVTTAIDRLVRGGWVMRVERSRGKSWAMGVRYLLCVPEVVSAEELHRRLKAFIKPVEFHSAHSAERSSAVSGDGCVMHGSRRPSAEAPSTGAENGTSNAERNTGGVECRSTGVLSDVQPSLPSEYSKELSKEDFTFSAHSRRMDVVVDKAKATNRQTGEDEDKKTRDAILRLHQANYGSEDIVRMLRVRGVTIADVKQVVGFSPTETSE